MSNEDEILKLKQLLDDGTITEQEYKKRTYYLMKK